MNVPPPPVDFAQLFAGLPARYLILLPDVPRHTIVAASREYLESTGRTLADLVGHGVFESFPENTEASASTGPGLLRASLARVCKHAVADRMPMVRYDVPCADGGFEERWWTPVNSPVCDAEGRVLYVVHRVEDATEFVRGVARQQPQADAGDESLEARLRYMQAELLRQSEDLRRSNDQLRASESRYRSLVENIAGMVYRVQTRPPWRFEYLSDGVTALSGYPPSYFLEEGHTWDSMMLEEDVARVDEELARQARNGQPFRVEYRIRHRDGSLRWVEGRVRPGSDPDVYEGTVFDIDERKRAEQALAGAQAAAEEALRAKSAFLSAMSHEIRTPLNAVLGFAGLLADTELGVQQRDFVNSIRASGDHLLGVINDILDFSKLESGSLSLDLRPCDLRQTVEAALDMVASQAGTKNLELVYSVAPDVPEACIADQARLRQVLVNLLGNAVKFTPRGEVQVDVSARALDDGRHEFAFAVRDTGIGIPPDQIGRLFRDFSQVDDGSARRFGGTGLGLAISKRLMEAHGGSISVQSTPGQGSTFTVHLRSKAAQLPMRAAPVGADTLRGRRVLVVDDNRTNLDILCLQARAWGMDPVGVQDPAAALRMVEQGRSRGETFDVAILDHQMPGLDGSELGRALRQQAQLPSVLLSSLMATESLRNDSAFSAVLSKPVHRSALLEALGEVFARRVESPAAAAAAGDAPQMPPLRLLLAEDNLVNRKMALLLLRKFGYPEVDVAVDGREAVEAVGARPYDVVLMDVEMPNLDGLQASRRIRAELPPERQPHIVAMTANALTEDREACTAAGMDDYVAKPVDPARLVQALLAAAPKRQLSPRELADERARRITAQVLAGGGESGALMRSIDWSQNPLGPVYTWPQSLRTALSILLAQKHPIFLWWGRELVQFYNDAYRPILGSTKHPRAMGQRGMECWREVWNVIGPLVEGAFERRESSMVDRGLLCLNRHGILEEAYFSYGYSPILDESGGVGGIFVACSEVTPDVLAGRRTALLLELDECLHGAPGAAVSRRLAVIEAARSDLPFILIYRLDVAGRAAQLVASTGLPAGDAAAPVDLREGAASPWPVFEAMRAQRVLLHTPEAALPVLAPWPEAPTRALVHPLGRWGVMVAGLSPRLILDEAYRTFVFRLAQRLQAVRELQG
jgi:PAS domain S-box-containing protein